jgi:hypothetical protein
MNTTTNTLTDRYVWAAARTLPEAQRAEFERELRERIGDQIDALVDHGRSPSDAERSVLHDLGDPAALAAGYVDRPLHLIGPRYFLTWWRLMKLMYTLVLPLAAGAIVLAQLLTEASIGEVIGNSVATILAIAVHLGFWITLAFAVIERMPNTTLPTLWETEMLPPLPDLRRSSRLGELIASAFFLVLLAVGIVWQQFASIYTDASGDPIPLLDPALWSSWLPYFLGLLAFEVLFAVAVYVWGWNWWLAASNLVLNVAFVVPALWLFMTGRLFNDAYLDAAGWPWGEASTIIVTIIVAVVVASSSWDVIDGVIKTARARSARRTSLA